MMNSYEVTVPADMEADLDENEAGPMPPKGTPPKKSADQEEDKWAVVIAEDTGVKWKDKSCCGRFKTILMVFIKICVLLGFLYLFICSLGLLGDAFKLLGGKAAGEAFRNNAILSNPIADLMMGVMVTVLLQSSSTTTSVVVAMVAASVLPVGPAIFIVMGANIGTSVTNTIVSMGHAYDRDEFRRAFAGATVHDMFNWLAVLILLPVEWLSASVGSWGAEKCGLLCQVTSRIVKSARGGTATNPELLKTITKPFLKSIIQIDKTVVTEIAKNRNISVGEVSQIKAYHCAREVPYADMVDGQCTLLYTTKKDAACNFLFEDIALKWDDWKVGLCILFFSLVLLCVSLILIVKLLNSMLKGPAAKAIQKVINAEIPKPFGWLTGYLVILVGTGLTILLQSSSIFTSTMTPLVGAGILHIERMYPLTLGANIGTTFTAILASLAIGSEGFERSMQVALCHFFFNILGICIWYPVPFMRAVPVRLAKGLGNTTAKHRWFALFYIVALYLCFPAAVFGLSLAGWRVMLGVLLPLFLLCIVIVVINVMQRKCPLRLHPKLRNWKWLPRPLHSLSFYDGVFSKLCACCVCCKPEPKTDDGDELDSEDAIENPPGYEMNETAARGYDNEGYSETHKRGGIPKSESRNQLVT